MSDELFAERDDAPTIEVRVFRHGELVGRELVESEEEATVVVERWTEEPGVTCEVDDLSAPHRSRDDAELHPEDLRELDGDLELDSWEA